jgi:hypothetical protein
MRYLHVTAIAVAAFTLSHSRAVADPRAPLDDVLATAAQVRVAALEMTQLLEHGRPDMPVVLQQLSILQERARVLREAMATIDVETMSLIPADRVSLQRARAAGDALGALLQNKAALLADPVRAERNRRLIRAKAEGIAKRAELVEDQVSRVRG